MSEWGSKQFWEDYKQLREEEYPKMRKEMEDDLKIKEMKETIETSLRAALSGFVGSPNTKELQKAVAEKIGDVYQELLQSTKDLFPAEYAPFDYLDERAASPNYAHYSDEEKRKMFGTKQKEIADMPNDTDLILTEVKDELERASVWPAMNSAHEGYAVLAEEVDELWEHVKINQKKRDIVAMRKEAVQVAAMAIRFACEVCNEERGRR
jgi:hypothetical protein